MTREFEKIHEAVSRPAPYHCSECGCSKLEQDMYKTKAPGLCLACFDEVPKITLRIYGWTVEGWALIGEELVPERDEYRLGQGYVEDFGSNL